MKSWHFVVRCFDGGHGWGTTGQLSLITVVASQLDKATELARRMIPGGWRIEKEIELPFKPGILHLYIPPE